MFVTVPLLDLHAQYSPIRSALLDAVTRVCDSQRFIGGPEVEGLERELAADLETPHAIGMSSGTDALVASLMAFNIGPGDEVITPTYSFFATAGAVARLGATPVLVDSEADTVNLNPAATIAAITSKTKAIIPVHLFGQAAELAPIVAAADAKCIAVIEDAAQAIGCQYQGKPVGNWGAVGCFSFFPSKNLGGFGDGGLVTSTNAALAHRLKLIRNHGMEPKYYHHLVGANFRIDALQAAVLRVKLPHLSAWSEARRTNAGRYRALFADAGLTEVTLPFEAPDRNHIYNQFVIRVPNRDGLRAHLDAAGIGTEVYYPVPFHLQECFTGLGYKAGAFPVAEAAAQSSLALPIYPELTEAQQAAVVAAIRTFYRG
jgi:dTDP-4-amino-4,6-dideoxygalactose transaminase